MEKFTTCRARTFSFQRFLSCLRVSWCFHMERGRKSVLGPKSGTDCTLAQRKGRADMAVSSCVAKSFHAHSKNQGTFGTYL